MNGTSATTFEPNGLLTRAMLVTILHRMEGQPAAGESGFADVPADAWYANAVAWARANGIVTGVSDTEFAPNNTITREQLAAILYRYANSKGKDTSVKAELAFNDAASVSEYAVDAMKWAVGTKLITGKGEGTLDPTGGATRAEVATILKRFIEQ